jgi:glycerophosphoryl diester phosphodiesterase
VKLDGPFAIVAHRGGVGWKRYAENSAEGFAESKQEGFRNECDVWASKEGEPVVIHDSTLNRTTQASGAVADFTANQLTATLLRTHVGPPSHVPLLRDVARMVDFVEIKPANAPELVKRIIQIMEGASWMLLASDYINLRHAQGFKSDIAAALVVDDLSAIDVAIQNRCTAWVNHELLDDRSMGQLRDAGISVAAWTVNTEEHLRRLLPLGPDRIITDVPRALRNWLRAIPHQADD